MISAGVFVWMVQPRSCGRVANCFGSQGSEPRELEVCNLEAGGGVAMGMFNCESSMYAFAEASMAMAYQKRFVNYGSPCRDVYIVA